MSRIIQEILSANHQHRFIKMDNQLTGKKILFCNVPADGHFNPLSGLVRYLLAEGADVRWLSSSIYEEKN
jgi:hypothetical protein